MTAAALAEQGKPISPFAVFRNRNFSLMWTGQLISTMGTALTSLASSIYVYKMTGSAASVGLMLMATAAPSLIVGLVAGVFVDRIDRKKIMIAADLIRAALVFLIPFLVPHSVAWLYVIVMLSSAVGQFFDPAHESVLPEVASERELAAANSLMAISSFGSTAVGFAASGFLASINIYYAFYLDAISFVISAICILLIRLKPFEVPEKASVQVVLRNLQAGMRHLFDTPILRSLFFVSIPVIIAFGLSNALLLPFANQALHATDFQYGIQEAMTSLGFVAGSLLLAGVFDRMREGPWIAISYLGMGLAGVAYSLSTSIPVAIVIVTISGFLNPPSSIGRRLVIQRNTPREMRGRVNSAFFVSRDVLFLIGMAAAGLADVINVRILYLVSAVLVLIAGVWVLFLPGLRQDAAQWRRALGLLRSARSAPGLGAGRAVTPADFDALVGIVPTLGALTNPERENLIGHSQMVEAPEGTAILRFGEQSDAAYFILSGKTMAGIASQEGGYKQLSEMLEGDFFGEIAALTGARRTADVVAQADTTLMQVPAVTLRALMDNPALSRLFLAKMTERLNRTSLSELPRFAGVDQQEMKELRTEAGS
jgi:MFS transporter, DHA3 family, macrolide efflux protein